MPVPALNGGKRMALKEALQKLSIEEREKAYRQFLLGEATDPNALACELAIGTGRLGDFWAKHYLEEYISDGGSKIKFVSGKPGIGKTQLLSTLSYRAQELGYMTVSLSAKNVWLHDFREIYLNIFTQVDFEKILKGCANRIIEAMGYAPEEIPEGMTFDDYIASTGEMTFLTRRQLREELTRHFLKNPRLDNNFACITSMMVGDILGHPLLDATAREQYTLWLNGEKKQKFTILSTLGLSPYRITKYNARHMLRSLCELIHMSGSAGLLVTIDDLDTVMNRTGLEALHYTAMRRNDTYESIREMIDDIDTMKYLMIVFGMDRRMTEDEKQGLKSYQALWVRIQSEIHSERFNSFTDIANLDELVKQELTEEEILDISQTLMDLYLTLKEEFPEIDREQLWREHGLLQPEDSMPPEPRLIDIDEAIYMSEKQDFQAIGIPRLINQTMFGLIQMVSDSDEEQKEEENANV